MNLNLNKYLFLKALPFLVLMLFSTEHFGQKEKSTKLGQTTKTELSMPYYEKDSLANAVVLYEHANTYIDEENKYRFRTDYYFRIKLFNQESFEKANISIPLFKEEKVIDIEAITYNLNNNDINKTFLLKDNIYTVDVDESWKEIRFSMPKIKEGSVIEYGYSVISPYSQLDDWYFQSDIPKIKSEYDASIVGNYKYKSRLIGFLTLDKNNPSIEKNCLRIPGMGSGGCNIYSFGMNNIPAFKEEEFMLSKRNYVARLIMDLYSFTEVNNNVKKYTTTWKNADNTLKRLFLDNQTTKSNYFKKVLPESILSIDNTLERAKAVYKYLQNHLFWDGKYWTQEKLRIKETFDEKSGGIDGINLILYNSLKAADIECHIVASATRKKGLPTKLYPITKDFNYILVRTVIDGTIYYLDASDKNMAFGQIPFRALNGEGRVLDFKNGGFWEPLHSNLKSIENIRANLILTENGNFVGDLFLTKSGYFASEERNKMNAKTNDDYIELFESENPYFIVNKYEVKHKNDFEKPLIQNFNILIDDSSIIDNLRFNPFVYGKVKNNPFKLKERKYAIDFGYPRSYVYTFKLSVPNNYEISYIPESKVIKLGNNGGKFIFSVNKKDNAVILFAKLEFSKQLYASNE